MSQHVHILGISGTFMSSIAILAREMGFYVTGCDAKCYPPVSDMLTEKQIQWHEGYDITKDAIDADIVIVGNVVKRGMPVIEHLLNINKQLWSGPQWLANHVLPNYKVVAVCGTHGKTSTTAMITHIFDQAGLKPGFLIGGVDNNLKTSARLGEGEWFIIESDEYDSAFFDKRPKMMHYRPHIAIINNLEFDHGDIYPNLAAIVQQFHYYLRTIPSNSLLLTPDEDVAVGEVLAKGCYCHHQQISLLSRNDWYADLRVEDGSQFDIYHQNHRLMQVNWPVIGAFNAKNALMAIAAGHHAGIASSAMEKALSEFKPVKRRLQKLASIQQIDVIDDFAHHPTAIRCTIDAVRKLNRYQRIIAVVEIGSNTMKQGGHAYNLPMAITQADIAFAYCADSIQIDGMDIQTNSETLLSQLVETVKPGDLVLFMSNKGFEGLQTRFINRLQQVSA
ncbi:UDP-N-acetylmuramate:L-alanyl-gamma-D-glutamyl-meso-diaminopimelate ligase [Legionella sp. W05-934-2]|uniref:UDP-N-acetylmuramate:L-alanyl-gamma-D-glutamyl- meso-diaminopimelate ligase n=1 Tax=Legionella sp. W05-934-2 TaxID=1198649 RepID=UPI003461D1B1